MLNVTGCGTDEALLESAYQKAMSEGTSQKAETEKEKTTTEKEVITVKKEETTTQKVEVATEETEDEELYEYEQKSYKDVISLNIPKDWYEYESDTGIVWSSNISEIKDSVQVQIADSTRTIDDCKTWSEVLEKRGYVISYEGKRACAGRDSYVVDYMNTEDGTYQRLIDIPLGKSVVTIIMDSNYEIGDYVDPFYEVMNSIQIFEKQKTDNSNVIEPGMYKVGKDIKAGTYMLFNARASMDAYMCVSSDANQDDIIFNENFGNNLIIKVKKGEYLELSGCLAASFKTLTRSDESIEKVLDMMSDRIDEGAMYLVGTTLEPGEYKLKRTDDGLGGYYCIYSDARHNDIVSNDYFDRNSTYVNVKKGDYLLLSNCKIVN